MKYTRYVIMQGIYEVGLQGHHFPYQKWQSPKELHVPESQRIEVKIVGQGLGSSPRSRWCVCVSEDQRVCVERLKSLLKKQKASVQRQGETWSALVQRKISSCFPFLVSSGCRHIGCCHRRTGWLFLSLQATRQSSRHAGARLPC